MTKALANPNQHLVKDKHLLEKLGRDQNSGPHFWRQTHNQRSKKLKKENWKFIWLPKLFIYGKGIWFYGNIPFVGNSNLEVNLAGKWLVLQESARLCLKHEKVKRGNWQSWSVASSTPDQWPDPVVRGPKTSMPNTSPSKPNVAFGTDSGHRSTNNYKDDKEQF